MRGCIIAALATMTGGCAIGNGGETPPKPPAPISAAARVDNAPPGLKPENASAPRRSGRFYNLRRSL